MTFKEAFINSIVVLSIFIGIGYMILARIVSNNSKAAMFMKKFSLTNWFNKPEEKMEEIKDKIIGDDRTMM